MLERFIAAAIALAIVLPTIVYGGTIGVLVLGIAIVAIGSGELWNMFSKNNPFPPLHRWILTTLYVVVFVALFLINSAVRF